MKLQLKNLILALKKLKSYKPKLPEGSAEYLAYIPEEWQESVYNAIVDENCNMTIKLKIAKEIYEAYKDNMTTADLDNYLFNKVPFYYEDEDNEESEESGDEAEYGRYAIYGAIILAVLALGTAAFILIRRFLRKRAQNRRDMQESPPSSFLNSEVSTVMVG